jgi:hypothetical protein
MGALVPKQFEYKPLSLPRQGVWPPTSGQSHLDFLVQNITTDRQENADLEAYIRDFLTIRGSKLITCDCPAPYLRLV